MNWRDHIVAHPDLLARGYSREQILAHYPQIQAADIQACLAYAGEVVAEWRRS